MHIRNILGWWLMVWLGSVANYQPAWGAASLLIWPIDPVLEDKQAATALWLESRDKRSVFVQIRVLKWQQIGTEDKLVEQKEIVASPPMAEIKPADKQLIRLIKNTQLAANEERAFRVLIDEIPRADAEPDTVKNGIGLKFQMRYSVPLFVQGAQIWTKQDYQNPRDLSEATQPILHYRLETQGKDRVLRVKNTGQVHARLSNVAFKQGKPQWVNRGLLGYVLAGSEMKFVIPNTNYSGKLEANVNSNPDPVVINSY